MKRRDIFICTLIFFFMSFLAADAASMGLRGQHVVNLPEILSKKTKTYPTDVKCSDKAVIKDLKQSTLPELRALDSFQIACGSGVSGTAMIFSDMPRDAAEAKDKGRKIAARLKEFKRFGVRPLVISEPVTEVGFVDFVEFRDGKYDAAINAYFEAIKAEGITDEMMGIWVPFPEANLPYWNHQSAKPEDFGPIVNRYVTMQKRVFPASKASVMLNSASYENSDFDWANGDYVSLLPYIKNINKGLIDSFGLQGFPWAPRAERAGVGVFDASEYLNYRLAKEAADNIGVKQIWFNTGSFRRKYTLDERSTVTVIPEKRKAVMEGIADEATKLRDQGYTVSVNIFAEDKSDVTEATDWSYWEKDKPLESADAQVFRDFARRLHQEKIEMWLFDR